MTVEAPVPACTCRLAKSDREHAPDCAVTLSKAPPSVPNWADNLRKGPTR